MKKLRTQLFCLTLLVLMLIPLLGSAATDQKGILSQVDIRTSLAALKSGESGSIDITPVDAFGEPIPLDSSLSMLPEMRFPASRSFWIRRFWTTAAPSRSRRPIPATGWISSAAGRKRST